MPKVFKSRVCKPNYIAEGFLEDAGQLLNEFADLQSMEFSDFAILWRRNYFSLIFMGQPDPVEATEFTNELFKISIHFLSSASFYEKVGALYLLYALYQNQILDPLIKIRVEISHFRIIKALRIESELKMCRILYHVINYLIKNAFICVSNQVLKGPITGLQISSKQYEPVSNLKATYKAEILEFSVSNNLKEIQKLHMKYFEAKKNLIAEDKLNLDVETDPYEQYQEFIKDLQELVQPSTSKSAKDSCLGSRRASIKAKSFMKKALDRFGNETEMEKSDTEPEIESPKKKRGTRTRRTPPHERRVGRPSRKPKPENDAPKTDDDAADDDDDIDFSHLLSQQNEFYLPPAKIQCKKRKTKRDSYYQVSPKREDSLSDSDDSL